MKKVLALVSVGLFLVLAAGAALALDNIVNIHVNDVNGNPVAPYAVGTTINIDGIITAEFTKPGVAYSRAFIQDETGGINLYSASTHTCFVVGDDVSITATVGVYNGMIEAVYSSYTINSSGNALPAPLVITIPELKGTFQPDYKEPNEGRLVRINNVTIVGAAGNWASTNYTISDGVNTDTLYIYNGSGCLAHPLIGQPIPTGAFDVVGILTQFDGASPYTAGYQISPRYVWDIIPVDPGPIITSGPNEDSLTTTSAMIFWTTNTASTSVVDYGPTTSYGSTTLDTLNLVTNHAVQLTGLSPNTVYHYKVSSKDALGTRSSNDHVLVTVSDVAGEFHIYFNRSVDTSYQTGTPAIGSQNFQQLLIDRINAAAYSIDCCFYSFSLSDVANALIAAKNRGVQVRFIVEQDNSGSTQISNLMSAGIPVITSTYGGNHGSAQGWGINHNKFAVFDCLNTASKTDDWVWTGSWNCSISGNDDANSALTIQDYGIASAYTIEFNEMWGSETVTPNASNSRQGNRKLNNTPHKFTLSGIPAQQYMSPSDGTEGKIIQAIGAADSSLYFCILSYTSNDISAAMKQKWDGVPGFQVRGVFDGGSIGPITNGSEWYALSGDPTAYYYWTPAADVWQDALPSSVLLHHKYLIIDSSWPQRDPTVITGSHNWSNAANTVNDENTFVIHDATVANLYVQEFAARYHEAGGTGSILVSVDNVAGVPKPNITLEAFPNPFNPSVNVRYLLSSPAMVSLRVYDVSGRLVRTLQENHSELPGFHSIPWDGKDTSGGNLGSGVYVVRLEAGKTARNEKVVLLK
ncbi:MAG: phospholipase D-like domain-containing protein [Candidatus Eisenbacteria bacterium]|nr:phospholipase D-like domain-containing protein [Candidatus Eisenbacteria bacterium]